MSKKEYLGIIIDESRTNELPEYSQYLVKSHYLRKDETIQEGYARAAVCWGSDLAHAQRLYDYASKRWFMWASPAFSNAILKGEKPRSMPISCFLPYVGDTIPDLMFQKLEFSILSVIGGGLGQSWNDVRPVSDKAPGTIPFIHENDGGVLAWKQGKTRRGALAAYIGIDHPDSVEFLRIRTPTGDSDRKSLNIHHGYCISDDFMQAFERGDALYPLTNPSNQKQEGEIDPVQHFIDTVMTRSRTGEPFMYFKDTANRALPLPQRMLGLINHATNLCTEITLAANEDRTPVCCLSSVNQEMYPEYKDDPYFIPDLIEMLDNIITFFIANIDCIAEAYSNPMHQQLIKLALSKVKYSAMRERSLGLGVMGWASLLQRLDIAFASDEAVQFGTKITEEMKRQAHEKSCQLGRERGVAPDIAEYLELCEQKGINPSKYWAQRRNLHLLAYAPTSNNSVILATSPTTEPMFGAVYSQEMRTGIFEIRNKYLSLKLESYGKDTPEVWKQIDEDGGSVQGLDFLTDHDKLVYLCWPEMSQMWIIKHAAGRQPNVCQAQSVNLNFVPGSDINYVVNVHYQGWKMGLKSLYYYRTETAKKVEKVNKSVARDTLEEIKKTIVYGLTTPPCPQCTAVKSLLTANGIEFEFIDLNEIKKTAAEVTGRPVRSVPQVYIDGEYIGGLKEVMTHLAKKIQEGAPETAPDCLACEG